MSAASLLSARTAAQAGEMGFEAWTLVVALVLLGVIAIGVWVLVTKAGRLDPLAARLKDLEPIRAAVERLRSESAEIELRRIEHALLDIRDGQSKIVDAMLRVAEAGVGGAPFDTQAAAGGGMEERVHNRLLALGYEGVEIARGARAMRGDWPEETDRAGADEGDAATAEAGANGATADGPDADPLGVHPDENTYELRVEARRQGVLHKGKVLVRDGRIYDVTMNPSYSIFP